MTRMHVQIQPNLSAGLNADAATMFLRALSPADLSRGEDDGPYINIDFEPTDSDVLWEMVREQLMADPDLAACSIVCCEGEHGWDDYLLLHHFDPAVPLDTKK